MKKIMKVGLLITLIACSGSGLAGQRQQVEVYVDKRGPIRYAEGTLVDARGSADTLQLIGCFTYSSGSGLCRARDSAGNFGSCYSTNPIIIEAMRNLNSDSYLFMTWGEDNVCTEVFVENNSYSRPGNISGY